jgi:hypothetical protein
MYYMELCGLLVRVSGYRDPEVWVRFPALPDFLRSSGSGTGFIQPSEYNRGGGCPGFTSNRCFSSVSFHFSVGANCKNLYPFPHHVPELDEVCHPDGLLILSTCSSFLSGIFFFSIVSYQYFLFLS